jgi:hypothetical protein
MRAQGKTGAGITALRCDGGSPESGLYCRLRSMKSELPPPSPALSLQNKLDQIAHDRDVLALLRDLARDGLREGDPVRRAEDGTPGRLAIDRQESPPRVVVATEIGSRLPFDRARWQRD